MSQDIQVHPLGPECASRPVGTQLSSELSPVGKTGALTKHVPTISHAEILFSFRLTMMIAGTWGEPLAGQREEAPGAPAAGLLHRCSSVPRRDCQTQQTWGSDKTKVRQSHRISSLEIENS